MAKDLTFGNRTELASWFPRRVQAKPPNCLTHIHHPSGKLK